MNFRILRLLTLLPFFGFMGCHIVPNPTPEEELAEQLGVSPDQVKTNPNPQSIKKTKGVIISIEPSGIPRKNETQLVVFKNDKTGAEEKFEILALSEDRKKSLIGRKVYHSNVVESMKAMHSGGVVIPTFEALFELR